MTDPAIQQLATWQNFYVIVGSSGAAIVGVQFVVIALIATMRKRAKSEAISAFATPTVVHLGAALLVSALMSAPWPTLVPLAAALAIGGLGGLGYGAVVVHRTRHQTDYRPILVDWLWHVILPCSAYAALALAAGLLCGATQVAGFAIAAAALGLLLIGIHNAWDSVTHIVAGADGDAAKAD